MRIYDTERKDKRASTQPGTSPSRSGLLDLANRDLATSSDWTTLLFKLAWVESCWVNLVSDIPLLFKIALESFKNEDQYELSSAFFRTVAISTCTWSDPQAP